MTAFRIGIDGIGHSAGPTPCPLQSSRLKHQMESTQSLPISLVILIHLHLLNYPLKDASGHDEHLFNPQRHGIGERTKTLEDVSYFLVTKIEGQKAQAKKILPSYPCSQPSDTVTYRTSLTKYMEMLKNDALKSNEFASSHTRVAWWWRDVIVRRSLLEECASDKFERLLLALSTHALANNVSAHCDFQHGIPDNLFHIRSYHGALTAFQQARKSWQREASKLYQRKQYLGLLQKRLSRANQTSQSKYSSLPTNKLVALSNSAYDDATKSDWHGEAGRRGLDLLIGLSGLRRTSGAPHTTVRDQQADSVRDPQSEMASESWTLSQAPPLPVEAAHFPATLRLLRDTNFLRGEKSEQGDDAENPTGEEVVPEVVADKLTNEERLQFALRSRLEKTMQLRDRLATRIEKLREERPPLGKTVQLPLSLPDFTETTSKVDFKVKPSESLLSKFSIASLPSDHESTVRDMVQEFRDSLKPSWPTIPDPPPSCPSPSPEPVAPLTRLPKPVPKPAALAPPASGQAMKTKVITGSGIPKTAMTQLPKPKETKKVGIKTPRKSDTLAMGRARRSSAFARRKSVAFDPEEVEKIATSFLNESTSDIALSRPTSPTTPHQRYKLIKGQPLTPKSVIKGSAPRPSFDMDHYERSFRVSLPRKSLGQWILGEDVDLDEVDEEEKEANEGNNSMTLKEILLQADATQYDLLRQAEMLDDSFDW